MGVGQSIGPVLVDRQWPGWALLCILLVPAL